LFFKWCFQFFFTKTFLLFLTKREFGIALAEINEYDAIFAALKHPVRRQILLFLEQKDEASFMQIQNSVGIDDSGLMSYHLKELAPLVEQSVRGKYRLSEIGETSITLFRRVEKEKQRTSTAVRKEIERQVGIVVSLFFIVGVTLMAPISVNLYVSAQYLYAPNLPPPLEYSVGLYFVGLSGIILGAIMFALYDRHYFSKSTKTNAVHSTVFAIGISLLLVSSAYISYGFEQATLPTSNQGSIAWLFMILHAVSLLGIAPLMAYIIAKLARKY
jgi:DNA-binding transcriptional ArsR family regulator